MLLALLPKKISDMKQEPPFIRGLFFFTRDSFAILFRSKLSQTKGPEGFPMAMKITKKQRVALRQIDEETKKSKRDTILAVASIALMAVLIFLYNILTYQMGVIPEDNTIIRGALYIIAVVIAGFCGIMLMRASRSRSKAEGYRQSVGISREIMEAWKKGEIDE